MGLVHAEITLDNPKQAPGNAVTTQALVDTGACCIFVFPRRSHAS